MAYDGWLEYNGVELVNLARTTQLAETLGIDTVWITPDKVAWIEAMLGGNDYDVIANAPWFDAAYPASTEFAGIIPLSMPGLDDSTTEASTTEYITDGGRSGAQRNATLPIVASVALVGSTERGVKYGKRWMDRVLRDGGARTFCSGVDLRYFEFGPGELQYGWVSLPVPNPDAAEDETYWGSAVDINPDTAPGGGPAATAIHAQVITGFGRDFYHDPIAVGGAGKKVRASVWVYVTGAGDDILVRFNRSNIDGSSYSQIGSAVTVNAGAGWVKVTSEEFITTDTYPYVYVTFTLEANASNANSWVTRLVVENYVVTNPSPVTHRRDVRLTRGASVTRKRSGSCSATWMATFTLTCDDPYEYGEPVEVLTNLGGTPSGDLITSGSVVLTEEDCPVYDYTPIYDPLYPALVPSPSVPDFYPAGWDIAEGMTFERFWARVNTVEPNMLNVVPLITLSTLTDARMVRVSIWGSDSETTDQCDPLFSAVISYLPANETFYIDGEQRASYVWDGLGESVRRTDSLVYSPDAKPVEWAAFNDHESLLVTLDLFAESGDYEGSGDVRVELSLIPKSD